MEDGEDRQVAMRESHFQVGELVALKADTSRHGAVVEVLPPAGGCLRYRVFHGPGDMAVYDEDQLAAADENRKIGGLDEAMAEDRWLAPDAFRARLTAARLAHPQVDTLYALKAARVKFIPFQMKPLLRFLQADQQRLLIADEVGVGKTIEAGLILKEMQSRQQVDNVLIICPKALVPKWRAEMRRFDEDFQILTPENLRYCLDETEKDGGYWPSRYSRSIVHLELLRIGNYLQGTDGRRSRPGLQLLDPAPTFDLVIIDEAHHVRNPGTNSYEVAHTLCDMAEAVIFLSATPVHIGSTNLFALLNLLRPDLFLDEKVFDEILEPNRFITDATRHVRTRAPEESWQHDAAVALEAARATRWGSRIFPADPRFVEWHDALRNNAIVDDLQRIKCMTDLQELHSLAQVMNRTRRRDIGRFTLREPHTVSVAFTPEQKIFYNALIEFRQKVLTLDYDPRVVRLITDTLERQAASCLPALLPTLDHILRTGAMRMFEVSDDIEVEEEDAEIKVPKEFAVEALQLREMANALPSTDPKFNALRTIIDEALREQGPGKVLVFSFFLHTLAYLHEKLAASGCRVELITGQVADEEREHLRDRFRLPRENPQAIDVLLSSEVGCEGLDYEFCDRMVNYDIPWNPMRVEQRIGRIDRFGQAAEKVLIFNFITPGTVEERIFYRCFERLGLFRDTVGDLEEVLGDVVQDLTRVAMDPALTPEQAEEKARQTADNAVRLMDAHMRLEEESSGLLGLDQGFMDELESAQQQGRFVSSPDLRIMVEQFLAQPQLEGKITSDDRVAGLDRLRLRKDGRADLLSQLRGARKSDRQSVEFIRWLAGNDPYLVVTFDQEMALERRDVPFITPVHPLAKLAVEHWRSSNEPLTANLLVIDDSIPAGRYLFVCELWRSISIAPDVRMVSIVYDLKKKEVNEDISIQILRLIEKATAPPDAVPVDDLTTVMAHVDEQFYSRRVSELRELRERNQAFVTRRLASIDAYYKNRLERVKGALQGATNERITRMREAEQKRVASDYVKKQREINEKRRADIVTARVAMGFLEVRHGE